MAADAKVNPKAKTLRIKAKAPEPPPKRAKK